MCNDTIFLRRTESARNLLVGLIKQLKAKNKQMMFRYMQEVRLYPHSFENFAASCFGLLPDRHALCDALVVA